MKEQTPKRKEETPKKKEEAPKKEIHSAPKTQINQKPNQEPRKTEEKPKVAQKEEKQMKHEDTQEDQKLTCTLNIDRINKGPDNWRSIIQLGGSSHYSDSDFPADQSSLFWDGHLREGTEFTVVKRYKQVPTWKTPLEIEKVQHSLLEQKNGEVVSLWGFGGVKPDAVQ